MISIEYLDTAIHGTLRNLMDMLMVLRSLTKTLETVKQGPLVFRAKCSNKEVVNLTNELKMSLTLSTDLAGPIEPMTKEGYIDVVIC